MTWEAYARSLFSGSLSGELQAEREAINARGTEPDAYQNLKHIRHDIRLGRVSVEEADLQEGGRPYQEGPIEVEPEPGPSGVRQKPPPDDPRPAKIPPGPFSQDTEMNSDSGSLSPTAARILNSIPRDGKSIGNIRLRRKLGLDEKNYKEGREELLRLGIVLLGAGKGGSVRRARPTEENRQEYYETSPITQINNIPPDETNQPETKVEEPPETEELVFAEGEEEEVLDEEPAVNRQVFSDKSDPSISDLYIRYKEGELILQPDFQRHFVWDIKKCSRLLESAILEVPLPMIYLAEEDDGREAVIDGQQRLTAFFTYLDTEYSLRGLKIIKELNGKYFKDLDRVIQNKIKRCSIRTTTIKKESSASLRFEIFERLNTGAVSLNDQELRNCIYRGRYNELLKELSADREFREAIGLRRVERRMKDVELVLRFAAFLHASYLNYTAPVRRFLNDDMERFQDISEQDERDLRTGFKNSLHIIRSLFGKQAFRRLYRGTSENPSGTWEHTQFSASLYDLLMYTFARAEKNQVYRHLDEIREAFLDCMTGNDDFIETIERGTSDKKMVTRRFDIWRGLLDGILAKDGSREPRCFSFQLKEALFSDDPTCSLCGQRIQMIDDAAIDHITQYWQGGRTIPENARLAHRYCNWARPRKGE